MELIINFSKSFLNYSVFLFQSSIMKITYQKKIQFIPKQQKRQTSLFRQTSPLIFYGEKDLSRRKQNHKQQISNLRKELFLLNNGYDFNSYFQFQKKQVVRNSFIEKKLKKLTLNKKDAKQVKKVGTMQNKKSELKDTFKLKNKTIFQEESQFQNKNLTLQTLSQSNFQIQNSIIFTNNDISFSSQSSQKFSNIEFICDQICSKNSQQKELFFQPQKIFQKIKITNFLAQQHQLDK